MSNSFLGSNQSENTKPLFSLAKKLETKTAFARKKRRKSIIHFFSSSSFFAERRNGFVGFARRGGGGMPGRSSDRHHPGISRVSSSRQCTFINQSHQILYFFAKQKLDKGFFWAFILSRKQKYLCPGAPLKHTSSPLGI